MKSTRKILTVATLLAAAGLAQAGPYSGLVILGDSLSDRGNVALAVGSDPTQAIPDNTHIPDRPYASGQFSNGDVWVKTFAQSLGLPQAAVPSLLGGSDFAWGGARMATDGTGLPPSLSAQTNFYLSGNGGAAMPSVLYVVEGGGNDARDALLAAAVSSDPFATILSAALAYAQAAGAIVDQLQAAGAEHIIVWDVPDLGTAPAVTAQGAGASYLATQVSLAMNQALMARLAGETGVGIFDFFGLEEDIFARPVAYGLINSHDACGAVPGCDPLTYLFWDGIHPTSAGHALLAQGMLAAVGLPEPQPLALLLCGLLLLRATARRQARLLTRSEAGKNAARARLGGFVGPAV